MFKRNTLNKILRSTVDYKNSDVEKELILSAAYCVVNPIFAKHKKGLFRTDYFKAEISICLFFITSIYSMTQLEQQQYDALYKTYSNKFARSMKAIYKFNNLELIINKRFSLYYSLIQGKQVNLSEIVISVIDELVNILETDKQINTLSDYSNDSPLILLDFTECIAIKMNCMDTIDSCGHLVFKRIEKCISLIM